jgi:hypothetical protein
MLTKAQETAVLEARAQIESAQRLGMLGVLSPEAFDAKMRVVLNRLGVVLGEAEPLPVDLPPGVVRLVPSGERRPS